MYDPVLHERVRKMFDATACGMFDQWVGTLLYALKEGRRILQVEECDSGEGSDRSVA